MATGKHWLTEFEGVRGLAYAAAIVSIVAPSMLAFFLLSPAQLFSMPWPLSLLLAASVGGTLSVVCAVEVLITQPHIDVVFSEGSNAPKRTARPSQAPS